MKGLNRKAVLEKYKKAKLLYTLDTGDSVVGQEIDTDNRLVYVMKRKDGTMELALAETQRVIKRIAKRDKAGFRKKIRLPGLGKQVEESVEGDTDKGDK